jgi:nucleoside phosphorylase
MYEEIKLLLEKVNIIRTIPALNRHFVIAGYADLEMVIGVTGVGQLPAGIVTQYIIDNFRVDKIYLLGTAGGLSKIEKGTLQKISKVSCDMEGFPEISLNYSTSGVHLYTSNHEICSHKQKEHLAKQGYDLVDMEGYGVVMAARLNGIPCEIVKVVSDHADENFQKDFGGSMDKNVQIPAQWLLNEIKSDGKGSIKA